MKQAQEVHLKIGNKFSQLRFLDRQMEAFRQRKWDLGESSLRSLIGSFENCSKASKKSPAPAYFVTNKISPPPVQEIVKNSAKCLKNI